MWIRSQDRDKLLDVEILYIEEALSSVPIYEDEEYEYEYDIKALVNETDITLGEYSSKEKALKVLDKIHKRIDVFNSFECVTTEYVYQMPQDNEVK